MYHNENPNSDARVFIKALEDNGLLERNFVDRYMPKQNKDNASRTEADIDERKAKQLAKLARRAKQFKA